MAQRTSWKGTIRISLVSIPVKAYAAINHNEGEIHLHQLHAKCDSRIHYAKTCPKHGVVPNDEIVLGYEYAKGQYVIIDEDDLEKQESENDKSITVDAVLDRGAIDPIYFTDRISYLVPDGKANQKSFSLIHRALKDQNLVAIARIVRQGKDETVMVRPVESLLVMTTLTYAHQVRSTDDFEEEVKKATATAAEFKLTKTLLEAFKQEEIDLSEYRDHYAERVKKLIDAKISGKDVVAEPRSEEPDIINLMDALRKSVASTKSSGTHKRSAPTVPTRHKPTKSAPVRTTSLKKKHG